MTLKHSCRALHPHSFETSMNFPPENILPPCEWTSQTASSLLIVIMKSFYYNILPQHDTVWLLMGCTTWKWSINMRYGLPCRIKKSRNVRGPKRHKISYKKSVKLVMFSEFFCIVLQLNYNAMISVQDETILRPSLSNWTKCECSLKLSVYPLCCLLAEPNMHLLVTKHCGCVLFRVPIWWCIKSIIFVFFLVSFYYAKVWPCCCTVYKPQPFHTLTLHQWTCISNRTSAYCNLSGQGAPACWKVMC